MTNQTNILLWGQVVIDRNEIAGQKLPDNPGGPAYFCARMFQNLKTHPTIISARGRDYNDTWVKGIDLLPKEKSIKKTFEYKNVYDKNGNRQLIANNLDTSGLIDPETIPDKLLRNAQAFIVCPLIPDVTPDDFVRIRATMSDNALLVCLPQGLFRRFKPDGSVYQSMWTDSLKYVRHSDIICLSEEDGVDIDTQAKVWSEIKPIVAVTRAERGCSVFEHGEQKDYPAFQIDKVIDPVGAGDVFAATFVYSYLQNRNTAQAAQFANAAGALSVCCHPQDMELDMTRIKSLIAQSK